MNLDQVKNQIQGSAILGALLRDGSIQVVYKQPIEDEGLLFRTWTLEVLIVDEDYTDQVRSALDGLGFELVQRGSVIAATKDTPITSLERLRINQASDEQEKAKTEAAAVRKEAATQGTLAGLQQQLNELKEDVDLFGLIKPKSGATGPQGSPGIPGRDGRDLLATDANLRDLKDVSSETPSQGNILIWQEASQSWELRFPPQSASGVGGGGGGGGGAPAPALTIQQRDRDNIAAPPTGIISNVSTISFDTYSGFVVEDLSDGTQEAFIKINSTFNPWHVDGQTTLDATGEEPVEFVAGSGISITTDETASPKQIIFKATGGGTGGGGGLENWTETETGDLLPNGAGQNIGSLDQPVKELFVSGNTVYMDGAPLSTSGGRIQFDGNTLGYGDGEVEEAPLDGRSFVRSLGQWVEAPQGGGFFDSSIDGGNFDTGIGSGSDSPIDGGNFDS